MNRFILLTSTVAVLFLGFTSNVFAAPANDPAPSVAAATLANPAATCNADVHSFNAQLAKEGYWFGGSDYGYGYPMGGMGYGDGYFSGGYGIGYAAGGYPLKDGPNFRNARPGYEIKNLITSATILARNGQQQGCEDILDTARSIYKLYVSEMQARGLKPFGQPDWRGKELAAARPVTAEHTSFRSDELLDAAVRNPSDQALGSVEDLVTNPATGKISYLIVARGGLFGFDRTYVPIPWDDFKVTPSLKILVLDTTKSVVEAAPKVSHDESLTPAQYEKESQTVDTYWAAHMPVILAK